MRQPVVIIQDINLAHQVMVKHFNKVRDEGTVRWHRQSHAEAAYTVKWMRWCSLMQSKPKGSPKMPGQELSPHRSSCTGIVASGDVLSVECAPPAVKFKAAGNGCWTLCKAVPGKIKAAASLLNHQDRSNLLLLQAFHDRAPMVLLSQGKQAEAERSGMLRARHEHGMPQLAPCCTLILLSIQQLKA